MKLTCMHADGDRVAMFRMSTNQRDHYTTLLHVARCSLSARVTCKFVTKLCRVLTGLPDSTALLALLPICESLLVQKDFRHKNYGKQCTIPRFPVWNSPMQKYSDRYLGTYPIGWLHVADDCGGLWKILLRLSTTLCCLASRGISNKPPWQVQAPTSWRLN